MNRESSYEENRIDLLKRIDYERKIIGELDNRAYEKSITKGKEGDWRESERQLAISVTYSQCYDILTELWLDVSEGKQLYHEVKMTAEQKNELKERYEDRKNTDGTVLDLLDTCRGDIRKVSSAMEYGIDYDDLLDLCAGYIFGTKRMREKIEDFLTDINFHEECSRIMHGVEEFYLEAINESSDYFKKKNWAIWRAC